MSDIHDEQSAPTKASRSRGARNPLVWGLNLLLSAAFLGALVFAAAFWYGSQRFDAPGPLAEATTFTVPQGASFRSIASDLAEAKIIEAPGPLRIFTRGVTASGKGRDLQAGEFAFSPGMSMRDVMNVLTEGRAIEYRITLPEGLTSYQMIERITFHPDLSGQVDIIPAEGTMRPDTYLFPRGYDRQKLVERIVSAQRDVLLKAWENRDPQVPLSSPQELLTLASIVEKETGVGSERAHVAGVFTNRLKKGMRLQTDPTIIYGIWGGKGKPKDRGGLRRSEIDRKTDYNTYQIDGLPPGPIANPGEAALLAAANPMETEDLYFVADGTGGHAFAATLDGHNANVAKWRKIEAERARALEALTSESNTDAGD
ncbi:MAG: endolytic transglycosylase MltG [Pseudomonadota bacterium]